MTEEMLDILIGKFLDSEITPDERRQLNEELDRNIASRRLFEAFHRIHVQSRAVAAGAGLSDVNTDDIFERAWRKSRRSPVRRLLTEWRRFAAGVAAGIMFGVGAFALVLRGTPDAGPEAGLVANADRQDTPAIRDSVAELDTLNPLPGDVFRQVDLYDFTDESGGRWLLEGLREKRIRPAVYYQDL